mmetsp:Transcript_22672/g.68264  ORF Transcript_22672/g.68264 Transcript_22672/m.68264 type:complete len:225 (-) Transcript_22672:1313-1987(-)
MYSMSLAWSAAATAACAVSLTRLTFSPGQSSHLPVSPRWSYSSVPSDWSSSTRPKRGPHPAVVLSNRNHAVYRHSSVRIEYPMSCVSFRKNWHCTEVPILSLANWLYAALLMLVLAGSTKTGASDVPLIPSEPATRRGSGSPASSTSVGKTSTISASTFVSRPTDVVIHGARMIKGMWTPSSKFVILAHVSCSPSWYPWSPNTMTTVDSARPRVSSASRITPML